MKVNEREFPVFPELEFEETKHTYTLDGQILPSVTTVMKPLVQACMLEFSEEVMKMAAERESGST